MSLDRTILSVQGTVSRSGLKETIIRQAGAIPPERYPAPALYGKPGTVEWVNQDEPQFLGAMSYYKSTNDQSFVTMYVVVSVEGVLVWKPVRSGVVFIDTETGKPWDPLSSFEG